jgi:hypothetical protein
MRYYCKMCGSEFRPAPHLEAYFQDSTVAHCPVCLKEGEGIYAAIPDFETPGQYEARTGKPWPDNAPVWFRENIALHGISWSGWCITDFFFTNVNLVRAQDSQIICAQGPEAPPDGWRPE